MAIVAVTRIAKALNLQPRRVQYLVKEGMPREARGKYDPVKCLCFYIRYLQALIDKRSAPREDKAGEGAARVRLLRAKADIRELQVARERSQLVAVADVQASLNELVDVTRMYMMPVAARLAPELVGETSRIMIQAKIDKAFKAALSALAKHPYPGGPASG
jgi:phage terminase Nu1 subunit (DNA packaging protein)